MKYSSKLAALTLSFGVNLLWTVTATEIETKDFKSAQLFQITNLWTVHFQFTPEQWQAMEPKGGGGFPGMFGGGGFGGGGFGGPGGRGGPGGMNAGTFLAPAFMKAGDLDRDSKLSRAEFHTLGEKWFADWDTNKTGKLNASQVGTGIGAALAQGNAGVPGRGGQGGLPPGAGGGGGGMAAVIGIEFKYVHADLEFQGARFKDVAVRYKGNSTFMMAGPMKRSLKVDLNDFVKGQKLAGLTKLTSPITSAIQVG